ncbi:MAG: amidohydrolase family protein [Woeseiaceae bacterium]|nr:amidohydrolase family protein [Woeseiaceae bacterium]
MADRSKLRAIDAVVNIWTEEALSHRPDWRDQFFVGKVRARDDLMAGLTLEQMLERMEAAGIERAFLIAPKSGRPGLPGCYHMPPEVVAEAVRQHPERFSGLIGIDPFTGMEGVRELERAVKDEGFIGAHLYPHWFELAPDHAKYYPFYAKCVELGVPIQLQVGQSLIYSKDFPCRSVGRPIALDAVACDFPELKLIGIHIGIPWTEEMIAMAWKHENLFIGCDAHSPKYWPQSFVHYINSYGQDKVIFGTDFPVLDFSRTIDEIHALGLKPEALKKLLRDNVRRIYELD